MDEHNRRLLIFLSNLVVLGAVLGALAAIVASAVYR